MVISTVVKLMVDIAVRTRSNLLTASLIGKSHNLPISTTRARLLLEERSALFLYGSVARELERFVYLF
jgi:hypothetical protein